MYSMGSLLTKNHCTQGSLFGKQNRGIYNESNRFRTISRSIVRSGNSRLLWSSRMQRFVCKRSFSIFHEMTHAFWNAITYGNTGGVPMKSLWKNKTELHDIARMRAITCPQAPKPYVKDWSVTPKKSKTQNNAWKRMCEEEEEGELVMRGKCGRRGRRRESQWNRSWVCLFILLFALSLFVWLIDYFL